MQPLISIQQKISKRPKSATTYPKKLPTYIVAFAVNENIKKASEEDIMSDKSSLQNSMTSMTSSSSTKTLKNSKQSIIKLASADGSDSMTKLKEICGDGNEEPPHIIHNNILKFVNINESSSQHRDIFVAQKHTRKSKFDTNKRKSKKYQRVVKVKNIHFKNQRSGNMTTKLKRYCRKQYKVSDSSRENQKELDSDTISKRVSRTRVLKKVLAKENLLADTKKSNNSLYVSFPSSDNPSFVSNSSQSTLTRDNSPGSINSVIHINDATMVPYKTDILNVAVAQINKTPILNRKSMSIIVPQKAGYKESLTSYESAYSQTMLTSTHSFEDTAKPNKNKAESYASSSNNTISNETLIPEQALSLMSGGIFQLDNSDFQDSSMLSDVILENTPSNDQSQKNDILISPVTHTFFDACMNLNTGSKKAPSKPDLSNTVIIADDIVKKTNQMKTTKTNQGNERFGSIKNDLHLNIFQKPFSAGESADYQKNLNLPDATQIKHRMVDRLETQRKCSEEVRDIHPTTFPELCDKLTLIFEIAIKKLEQNLSERIIDELHEIDKRIHSKSKFTEDVSECTIATKVVKRNDLTQSGTTIQKIHQTDAYLQCDIVQNEVIDKLMTAFSEEFAKSYVESSSSNYTHKLKNPKFVKDYFEVLKAPAAMPIHVTEEVGKGDSVQIAIEEAVEQQIPRFSDKKRFWTVPIAIIRENMFVFASVPGFLFVMFVVYSYVLLIIRMWWY